MVEQESKDSFSSKDLNAVVDVFEDVQDAPRHENDTFDPVKHLAEIRAIAEADRKSD